ncbi:NIPSNAP family containing protein [Aquirufa ecclesiirivi]|uniref:NIPSNAP family containing protein n=1 Tax=Aquirufa ecclesiirivi TaxID=2715124 RepID=A0ABT4JIM9_9BACT|nr:NIPSNAP family protein [Aquirufa ecclesiirivi]MCZ2476105.1 NIPSNAP family containing protein [Aquirufa ecclesiirivi]MDF0693589.1 NIPSNAP family protein [Aquirufa ecclesiirivi]
MKKILALLSLILLSHLAICQEYYEVRTYQMKFRGNLGVVEKYISNALIPALNKYGVSKVGVFKDLGKPEPAILVVTIPFSSLESYAGYKAALEKDETYLQASKAYFDMVGLDKPLFEKISTYLAKGFKGHPVLSLPTKNEGRIYEWRTYESYNEDALRRKIAMFDDAELQVFENVGLHRVFFGEVLAGENTPCLTYMISFENMAERDKNWAKFSADPEWKRISNDPKYANSHSRTVRRFLEPTAYSQW